MGFHIGNYKDDAAIQAHHGWIVGAFMEDGPRKRDELEVKYWEFNTGPSDHPTKISETLECSFILQGSCEGFIGDEKRKFTTGEYFVIEPGTPNNVFVTILEPMRGITVKAPSDPSAKKVIS